MANRYWIWCFERSMYWRSHERGYTPHVHWAGEYDEKTALRICNEANIEGLNEAMIPVSQHLKGNTLQGCAHEILEPHTCPYAQDIGGIDDKICTCCWHCQNECAEDI
jgi:hypothetical protein